MTKNRFDMTVEEISGGIWLIIVVVLVILYFLFW